MTVNGKDASLACPPGTFATLAREFRDGDTIVLRLPMRVQLEDWLGGRAVTVKRGPLVYSLRIAEKRVENTSDVDAIRRVLKGNNIQGFAAIEFYPQSEWRYGVDQAQKITLEKFRVIESPMSDNPFLADHAPVRIETPLHGLPRWAPAWKPVLDTPAADLKQSPQNPASLPDEAELQAAGPTLTMTLLPYGSTHLRLTTLPVIPPTHD